MTKRLSVATAGVAGMAYLTSPLLMIGVVLFLTGVVAYGHHVGLQQQRN